MNTLLVGRNIIKIFFKELQVESGYFLSVLIGLK